MEKFTYPKFIWASDMDRLFHELSDSLGYTGEITDQDEYDKKIECNLLGDAPPGSKVKIIWKRFDENDDFEEPITDHGYILTLPCESSDDIWMSGIVHIPEPYVEKATPIPEWHTLDELVKNERIEKIIIY